VPLISAEATCRGLFWGKGREDRNFIGLRTGEWGRESLLRIHSESLDRNQSLAEKVYGEAEETWSAERATRLRKRFRALTLDPGVIPNPQKENNEKNAE